MKDDPLATTEGVAEGDAKNISISISEAAYVNAPRVYAQAAIIQLNAEEGKIIIGDSFSPGDRLAFVPETILYFTIPHLKRFSKNLQTQLSILEQSEGVDDGK